MARASCRARMRPKSLGGIRCCVRINGSTVSRRDASMLRLRWRMPARGRRRPRQDVRRARDRASWTRPLLVVPASLRSHLAAAPCGAPTFPAHSSTHEVVEPRRGAGDGIRRHHRGRVPSLSLAPNRRRHAVLAGIAAHAPVLLLSATPLQNGARDLAAQIALFLGRGAFHARRRVAHAVRGIVARSATIRRCRPSLRRAGCRSAHDDGAVLDAILALAATAARRRRWRRRRAAHHRTRARLGIESRGAARGDSTPAPNRSSHWSSAPRTAVSRRTASFARGRAATRSPARLRATARVDAPRPRHRRRERALRSSPSGTRSTPSAVAHRAGAGSGRGTRALRSALCVTSRRRRRPRVQRVRQHGARVLRRAAHGDAASACSRRTRHASRAAVCRAPSCSLASRRWRRAPLPHSDASASRCSSPPTCCPKASTFRTPRWWCTSICRGIPLGSPSDSAASVDPAARADVASYLMAPPTRTALLLRAEATSARQARRAERTIGRGPDVLPAARHRHAPASPSVGASRPGAIDASAALSAAALGVVAGQRDDRGDMPYRASSGRVTGREPIVAASRSTEAAGSPCSTTAASSRAHGAAAADTQAPHRTLPRALRREPHDRASPPRENQRSRRRASGSPANSSRTTAASSFMRCHCTQALRRHTAASLRDVPRHERTATLALARAGCAMRFARRLAGHGARAGAGCWPRMRAADLTGGGMASSVSCRRRDAARIRSHPPRDAEVVGHHRVRPRRRRSVQRPTARSVPSAPPPSRCRRSENATLL